MVGNLRRYIITLNPWLISAVISLLLLVFFMVLQAIDSTLLDLDTKWLVVASIPLLVTALKSNIIKRFQGFGIELETRLEEPIGRVNLVATDALVPVRGGRKLPLKNLYSLDSIRKQEIERLTFVQGSSEYTYDVQAVKEYIEHLPNLKFVEVREGNRFVALLPISVLCDQDLVNSEQIKRLLDAIENRRVNEEFGTDSITEPVSDDMSLIVVLPKLRESRFGLLPVTASDGELLGLVTTPIVEKRIADAVIATQRSA